VIIDTSALLSILRDEPEATVCAQAIEDAPVRRISAASFLEAAIVIDASGDPIASRRLDQLIDTAAIEIVAVTAEHAQLGRAAYRDFGRGSGHPAQLNFGDCFAYALARATGEALLFKGADFGLTDLRPAVPSEHDAN
jgi:ribonuclease VapC